MNSIDDRTLRLRVDAKGIIVKTALSFFGLLIVTAAIATPAEAQNRPWCAYYSGRFGRRLQLQVQHL